jgi:hypothetical protein
MIYDCRLYPPASPERLAMAGGDFRFKCMHLLTGGIELLNLNSAFSNLKSHWGGSKLGLSGLDSLFPINLAKVAATIGFST